MKLVDIFKDKTWELDDILYFAQFASPDSWHDCKSVAPAEEEAAGTCSTFPL